MKKLLIAMLLLPTVVLAQEKWLEMPNQAGGKILLLFAACDDPTGRIVIATRSDGRNTHGCWYYFADMVHVRWKDNKTSSFEPSDFTLRESK